MNKLKKWMSEDIQVRNKFAARDFDRFEVMVASINRAGEINGVEVLGSDSWMRSLSGLAMAPKISNWDDLIFFVTKHHRTRNRWELNGDGDVLVNERAGIAVKLYEPTSDDVVYIYHQEWSPDTFTFETGSYRAAVGADLEIESWEDLVGWIKRMEGKNEDGDDVLLILKQTPDSIEYTDWEFVGADVYIRRLR